MASDQVDPVGQGIITKVGKIRSSGNIQYLEKPRDMKLCLFNETELKDYGTVIPSSKGIIYSFVDTPIMHAAILPSIVSACGQLSRIF
jgi:hypothetical protein